MATTQSPPIQGPGLAGGTKTHGVTTLAQFTDEQEQLAMLSLFQSLCRRLTKNGVSYRDAVATFQCAMIRAALNETKSNKSRAARHIKLPRNSFESIRKRVNA